MPYLGATTLANTIAGLKSQAGLPKSGEGLLSSLGVRTPAASRESTSLASKNSGGPATEPVDPRPAQAVAPQVERLRGLSYVPAVLWVAERVADGLAHAHERGILHRDLKPANILFADDGEPVLLDFNLAADTRARAGAAVALVGGTLPYMAPEHLSAFLHGEAAVDPRSDLYALGVVLYELLAGTHPFPVRTGAVDTLLPEMIADRLAAAPDVRQANPAVSPAVASLLRHCLEPDPERRYASARALQEDLRRQLEDLPLRHASDPSVRERAGKWLRRHPRLTSSTTVAVIAAVLLAGLGSALAVRHGELRKAEAIESRRRLDEEWPRVVALLTTPNVDPALAEEGLAICKGAAARYRVLDDPAWLDRPLVASLPPPDRAELRRDLGDLLVLWAETLSRRAASAQGQDRSNDLAAAADRLDRAEACFGRDGVSRALVLARAELARLARRPHDEVRRLREAAEATPLRNDRERLLVDPDRVDPDLRRRLRSGSRMESITERDPRDFAVWIALGNWNVRLGRSADALAAYNVAVALAPRHYGARYNRGKHLLERQEFSQALEDLDTVIDQRPDLSSAYLNRALAKRGIGDARGAIDDLTRCLNLKGAPPLAWFVRAQLKQQLGDREGAQRDRQQGLRQTPRDPASLVARGLARLPADPQGALADFDAALAIAPRYRHALQDKAHVLSEHLGQPDRAVAVLDLAVESHPDSTEAVAGRGVLLARLGRRAEALRDARAALALNERALTTYQAACIYALTSKQEPSDSTEALRLLAEAVCKDRSWLAEARKDADLDPIRPRPAFRNLVRALESIVADALHR
jgi:tetratricopeptide (TPR) repeat protein